MEPGGWIAALGTDRADSSAAQMESAGSLSPRAPEPVEAPRRATTHLLGGSDGIVS
jgi:hypothetical protein